MFFIFNIIYNIVEPLLKIGGHQSESLEEKDSMIVMQIKTHLFLFSSSEGLPTDDVANAIEKLLMEWKGMDLQLEEVAKKMQYQDEVNIYVRELDELDKNVRDKELWLKVNSIISAQQQPLTTLKESCQVIFICSLLKT